MKNFKKDLDEVVKTAKVFVVKVEKLQKQYAEMVKKHPKMPAKRAPTQKTAAKKTVAKKAGVTTADTVLAIVKRSKKGIDSATAMKKTGYDKKKVANIFFKLKKQGKIKSGGKGIYVKG